MNTHHCDVLVVGSGLAGQISALKAAESGAQVMLVEGDQQSASAWAQGGIVEPTSQDADALREDILNAGCKINNEEAIDIVIREGERCIREWLRDKAKVPFDKDKVLEAAHSSKRILHIKDHSGSIIMEHLAETIDTHPNIEKREGLLVDLLLTDRHDYHLQSVYRPSQCAGAYVFNQSSRVVETVAATATVLSTGGFSALYEHSTGPRSLTGNGIAAAHRVGAKTLHLEYVQFHPTALYIKGQRPQLLSEALRGAGAKLLNEKKESFVNELAPRDLVARSIHSQLLEQSLDHVWLDARKIVQFEVNFPSLYQLLQAKHIDPSKHLIPVVPAAHYTIGGIWTDPWAQTSIPGLMAAGEVACTGLHGANRLASTSLLEALVFGERAGESAAQWWKQQKGQFHFDAKEWAPAKEAVDPALLKQDWQLLRRTMWNYVGLSRNSARLKRAERMLQDLRSDVENFYKTAQLNESLIGLRQSVLVATLVLYAALRNPKSLGTHFREN